MNLVYNLIGIVVVDNDYLYMRHDLDDHILLYYKYDLKIIIVND